MHIKNTEITIKDDIKATIKDDIKTFQKLKWWAKIILFIPSMLALVIGMFFDFLDWFSVHMWKDSYK